MSIVHLGGFKFAIIGAGPAGCMLARLLSLSDIPVTVYESDLGPNYRAQGGTLDLHSKTGLAAMKEARLWDEFCREARFASDYTMMCDKDFNAFVEVTGSDGTARRPEIDRSKLRQILTESLPDNTIKWGHRLQSVKEGDRLVFEHSTESGFDLIVGCDGAWSKVRNYITTVKPQYSGVGYHQLSVPDAEQTASQFLRVGNVSVRPENWVQSCGYDPYDLEQTKKAILEELHDWCLQLREAIEKAQGDCDPKSLYMLPVGWRREHRQGVMIIVDAAHLMPPFAGEGVNVALDDARKLAAAIVRSVQTGGGPEEIDKQIRGFEQEMFPRMEMYQRVTNEVTQLWLFTKGELRRVVPKVLYFIISLDLPRVVMPLVWVLLYSWWFVKTRLVPNKAHAQQWICKGAQRGLIVCRRDRIHSSIFPAARPICDQAGTPTGVKKPCKDLCGKTKSPLQIFV
ncbi:hypothetical protein F4809DRAFT_652175 [Biscogniauxia mediterranea]|nr:hypothetical protein F4809DRAFT_652175 [Biscogniauxia mediterranea]